MDGFGFYDCEGLDSDVSFENHPLYVYWTRDKYCKDCGGFLGI